MDPEEALKDYSENHSSAPRAHARGIRIFVPVQDRENTRASTARSCREGCIVSPARNHRRDKGRRLEQRWRTLKSSLQSRRKLRQADKACRFAVAQNSGMQMGNREAKSRNIAFVPSGNVL